MKLEGFYHKMVTVHSYDDSAEELLNELEEVAEIKERKMSYEVEPYQLGTRNSIVSLEKNAEFQMKNLNGLANITMNQEIDDPRVPSANFISTFFRILGWARPEWSFLIIGAICAGLYGVTMPVFSVVLAELYGSLAKPTDEEVLEQSASMAIISLVIGIAAGVVCYIQTFFFNLAGVWLTTRMR